MKINDKLIDIEVKKRCLKSLVNENGNDFLKGKKNDIIKFVKAGKNHVNIIKLIENETLPSEAYSEKIILENIVNKSMLNYILYYGSDAVGYICCSYFSDDAELLKICVKKKYQHNGFGQKLLHKLIEKLKALKVENVFLEVRENN